LCSIQACTRRSMCTAVVGGSIQRIATSSSDASSHSPAAAAPVQSAAVRSAPLRPRFAVFVATRGVTLPA